MVVVIFHQGLVRNANKEVVEEEEEVIEEETEESGTRIEERTGETIDRAGIEATRAAAEVDGAETVEVNGVEIIEEIEVVHLYPPITGRINIIIIIMLKV